jgi:hypothetical protein
MVAALGFRSLASLLSQIPEQLARQVDFRVELANMQTFAAQLRLSALAEACAIKMPTPIAASRDVLLMSALPSHGKQAVRPQSWSIVASRICALQWELAWAGKLMHGDLHTGNIGIITSKKVKEAEAVVLYDFGLMTQADTVLTGDMVSAIAHKDTQKLLHSVAATPPTIQQLETAELTVDARCENHGLLFVDVFIEALLRHPSLRTIALKPGILDILCTINYQSSMIKDVLNIDPALPASTETLLAKFEKSDRQLARGFFDAATTSYVLHHASIQNLSLFAHTWKGVEDQILFGLDKASISTRRVIHELTQHLPAEAQKVYREGRAIFLRHTRDDSGEESSKGCVQQTCVSNGATGSKG